MCISLPGRLVFNVSSIRAPKSLFTQKYRLTVLIVRMYMGCTAILLSCKMAGNKYRRAPTSPMGDANGLHHGGRVFSLVVVVDKHKQPYFYFTAYLLWCMRTSPHHEIHCHMLDKG